MSKNLFTTNRLFIFFSVLFFLIIVSLYFQSKMAIRKSNNEIHRIEINRASKLSSRILKQINIETSDNLSSLSTNPALRSKLNKLLSLYITDEFKYIYVIYSKQKGEYRYLLDGSSGLEKGLFRQEFNPILTDLWVKSIKEKKAEYSLQQDDTGLWITYLRPIVKDDKVRAVLALDISTQKYLNFHKILLPFDNFLTILLIISIMIIITISILNYLFYRLRKQSMIDPLTRLYNRKYLNEISTKIDLTQTAIMMVDIDYFKKVNDEHGHDVGDIVLYSIAKRFIVATRLDDKVMRYGGEEFLILVRWPKNKYEVIQIAKRVKEEVSKEAIRVNEKLNLNITVSIGINPEPQKSQTLKKAIKIADEMLYLAKDKGRDRIEVYKGNK